MDLTPGMKALLPWWGIIQSAVSQRVQTADLWTIVRDAATREGVELKGVSAADMSRMRAVPAGQRNAGDTFMRARPTDAITADMIAQDISSRSPQDQLLAPRWIARFEHDITVDGELQTHWRASVFEGSLPATAGDLRNQLEQDAEQMMLSSSGGIAAEETTHLGIGRIQIVAV